MPRRLSTLAAALLALGCSDTQPPDLGLPAALAAPAADALATVDLDNLRPEPANFAGLSDPARERLFRRILCSIHAAPAHHTAILRHGDLIALAYWLSRDPDTRLGALALWAERAAIDRPAKGDHTGVHKTLAGHRRRFAKALGPAADRCLNPY